MGESFEFKANIDYIETLFQNKREGRRREGGRKGEKEGRGQVYKVPDSTLANTNVVFLTTLSQLLYTPHSTSFQMLPICPPFHAYF